MHLLLPTSNFALSKRKKTMKTMHMNEVLKLKTGIILLIISLLAINVKAQTKALTPKQCIEQYMVWKSDPIEIDPDNLFHPKMELHWMERNEWHKKNGQDYIQKIQAGIYLEREQELLYIQQEKKMALARVREVFPADQLVTSENLQLKKHKGYWQITEILITYQSIEDFTSELRN